MATGPYAQDILTRIINVHWSNLYLVVRVYVENDSGHLGLDPSQSVPTPNVKVEIGPDFGPKGSDSVKLIDEYHDPKVNSGVTGYSGCLQYIPQQTGVVGFAPGHLVGTLYWSDPIFGPVGETAQQAYDDATSGRGTQLFATDPGYQSCTAKITSEVIAGESAWSSTESRDEEWSVRVDTVPVNGFEIRQVGGDYLYSLPEGDNVITVTVGALVTTSNDGIDYKTGSGAIVARIYSTAREEIKKLSQLIHYGSDDKPKLDPDSWRTLTLDSTRQGAAVKINVHIDNDDDAVQIDNYGKTFHPYKVTFDPSYDSQETIPAQPPQLLPLPDGTTAMVARPAAPKAGDLPPPAQPPQVDDWIVKSVNRDTQQTSVPGSHNTITVLDSVTYHNPSTGEVVTVPVSPG